MRVVSFGVSRSVLLCFVFCCLFWVDCVVLFGAFSGLFGLLCLAACCAFAVLRVASLLLLLLCDVAEFFFVVFYLCFRCCVVLFRLRCLYVCLLFVLWLV